MNHITFIHSELRLNGDVLEALVPNKKGGYWHPIGTVAQRRTHVPWIKG
jgi:hypothetical protein